MPRYAKPNVTIDDLKKLVGSIDHLYDLIYHGKSDRLVKDLSKIEVDFENLDFAGGFTMNGYEPNDVFEMLDGYPVAWCCGAGDWEIPIAFVVYIGAEDELRAYIPKNGNCYNVEAKAAYGNEDDEDFEVKNEDGDLVPLSEFEPFYDIEKMKEDVMNRIKVKG